MAAYLRQRRWTYEYEPVIPGSNRRLDFRIDHRVGSFFIEVYDPTIPLPDAARSGFIDSYVGLGRAFSSRKRAQVKAAKDAGLPYVGAVTSANAHFGIQPIFMMGAMFGEVGYTFPVDMSETADGLEPGRMTFGQMARLQRGQNRGVSAVAIPQLFNPTRWRLEQAFDRIRDAPDQRELAQLSDAGLTKAMAEMIQQMAYVEQDLTASGAYDPSSRRYRMVVLHNPFANLPVQLDIFSAIHDEQWGGVLEGTTLRYERLWQGRLSHQVLGPAQPQA